VTDMTCHAPGVGLDMRKHAAEVDAADAVLCLFMWRRRSGGSGRGGAASLSGA